MTTPSDQPAAPAGGMPPTRQWVILAIVAGVALALFLLAPAVGRLFAPKPPPPAPAPPPGTFQATAQEWSTLGFAKTQLMDFVPSDTTEGKISVDETRTTAVFSPYTGRITRVMAQVGDHVRAGQPLFAVNAAEFVQAQSDLLTAGAQVRLTKAALERQQALLKVNGAALKDVQQAQNDYATAMANLEAARNRLRVLGMSAAQVAATEAGAGARGIAPDTVVVSPITGVITQRSVGPGQNLASLSNNGGGTPAFTVSDLSRVWLVGDLRELDAPLAHVGELADVRVGALPGRVFRARVDFVSPIVDPTTRRVTVRASIANPGRDLLPDMYATFDLITGPIHQALGVPTDAVIYEGDTARVWVARPNRVLGLRTIKTGQTHDGMVEVVSGLQAGEVVVTSGSLFIDRASKGA
ncbi:MAG: efflux RND transporter periplasmic adaptor subunit [Caulobacteraceae bacterium]|nr:efflux RND transporter periplasmic adaptor subunit [Caulobacteraceae bacterium]